MADVNSRHYDAVVIGSGAAGSIAVKELTERGMDVLLLEAGRDITEADFVPPSPKPPAAMSIDIVGRMRAMARGQIVQSRRAMFQYEKNKFLVNDLKHPYTTRGGRFLWIRGQQLGGRLHSYGRVLLRASDHEFQSRTLSGRGDDWPINYADLEPYYDRVEEFIGLYGMRDGIASLPDGRYRGPSLLNAAEQEFKQTVEGQWANRHVIPWRYAAPNLHRVPLGIVAARATGRLATRTDAIVRKIVIDQRTGRASGAVFIDRRTKREYEIGADVVILCASTIESVRILLNSATDGHPNGLANSSGVLGRYFMDQTPSLLFGEDPRHPGSERPDPAPPDPYYPTVGGVYIPAFENVGTVTNTAFQHGWAVQGSIGRIPVPEGHPGTVGLMAFGEMPAYADNSITLDPVVRDAWGIRVPRIRLSITDNERSLLRAQVAGLREMARASGYSVNFAGSALGLDSKKVWPNADPISRALFVLGFRSSLAMGAAIHECGGARMGSDPASSVVNHMGQAWDVPNLFITDASTFVSNGAVGPTLTIMALTARTCEFVAAEHASGALAR